MGVSKNNGTPKWMVKIRENPTKMHDLGCFPIFLETPIYTLYHVGIYWIDPLSKGSNSGVKQLGALHPKGPPAFYLILFAYKYNE